MGEPQERSEFNVTEAGNYSQWGGAKKKGSERESGDHATVKKMNPRQEKGGGVMGMPSTSEHNFREFGIFSA